MDTLSITAERKAQLDDYAKRNGEDTATVVDRVLGDFLEEQQQDYRDTLIAARNGHEDMQAGRTRPAAEFLENLREKHGFPR